MANEPTFIEKMRGKRTSDIELPNESGKVDPRLPKPTDPLRGLKNAAEGYKKLQEVLKK